MSRKWKTQNGDLIPYKNLKDYHLSNIIKWIEKKAKDGMILQFGGGSSPDDMWYEEEVIYGSDVLSRYDHEGLLKELSQRAI